MEEAVAREMERTINMEGRNQGGSGQSTSSQAPLERAVKRERKEENSPVAGIHR